MSDRLHSKCNQASRAIGHEIAHEEPGKPLAELFFGIPFTKCVKSSWNESCFT